MSVSVGFERFVALHESDRPDLLQRMGTEDLPVDGQRYGVVSRLIARPGAKVVELAVAVLEKLARELDAPASSWGGVVLTSRSLGIEQAASEVGRRMACDGPAVGVERACSGFPAATEIAATLCRERRRPIAIAAVEIISQQINWEAADGNLADQQRARGQASKLFADGAASVLVAPGEAPGRHRIRDAWAGEVSDDKQLIQKLDVPDARDPWNRVRPGITTCISMPGRRGFLLFKKAPRILADAVESSLRRWGEGEASVAEIVPHQANGLILEALEKEWIERHAGPCRVWNCFRDWGNTVSASIPIAMAQVQDQLPAGATVALPSVGAGGPGYRPDVLSTGCVMIEVGRSDH